MRALHVPEKNVSKESFPPWRGLKETFTAILLGIIFYLLHFLSAMFSFVQPLNKDLYLALYMVIKYFTEFYKQVWGVTEYM